MKSTKTTGNGSKKPSAVTSKTKTPKKDPETAKPKGSCGVCFNDFENKEEIVQCPFCPSKNCLACSQDHLLGATRAVPRCMSCKKDWPTVFFTETFPASFRKGPYLESKKKMLLEEQTAALPATMPLVEAKKKEKELRKEGRALKLLRDEALRKAQELADQIAANEQIIKTGVALGANKAYMFKCPRFDAKEEQCRGFIERESHSCSLCKTRICKDCHVVLEDTNGEHSNSAHACKKEDVESAKMVLAETKPCPTCSARIFKIQGCDQMFCTMCNTPFSWTTGNIETGVIHNPHYYELMRKLGNNRRVAGDVPCGGLTEARFFMGYGNSEKLLNEVLNIHRRTAEISTYIRNRNREANAASYEEIRVNFLMGKLTEDQFRERLFERNCLIEKRREELQILSTFEVSVIERLNKLVEDMREVWARRVLRAEYEKKNKVSDDEEGSDTEEDERYDQKTVVQLKEILRKKGLAVSGLKAELVQRLLDADNGIEREDPQGLAKQRRRRHRRGKVRTSAKKGAIKAPRVKSEYMILPVEERKRLIDELFVNLIKEVDGIVDFCNKAFKDSFTALGYDEVPIIKLTEEYAFLVPKKLTLEEIRARRLGRLQGNIN